VDAFPSLKAARLLTILQKQPLGYTVTRQKGSHRQMDAEGRPRLTFAFHDADTIPGGMVRKILVDQVGLDAEIARKLV
jgi:predicted RNA binding protein YcfA (HicA-like mRNA interferase family)